MMRSRSLLLLLLIPAGFSGCADPADPAATLPVAVEIFPPALTFVSLGDTLRLRATVRNRAGERIPGAAVLWVSSHGEVAQIDTTGLVTSVANGEATIQAVAGSANATAMVEVDQVPATIELRLPRDSLSVGDSLQLDAEALDALGSTVAAVVFDWQSSDSTVVQIIEGWAHALAPGPVTLTAHLNDLVASAPFRSLPLSERVALGRFYNAAGGPVWKNNTAWLSDRPLADWHGVTVDHQGRVVALVLTDNGLIGTIPPEIAGLPHLQILHIGLNALTGPIPPEIGELLRLRSLELTYNSHTGSIPPEIGKLTELVWLGAFGNELEGAIPPEIGNLRNLEMIDLCYNRLTGPIPPEIGRLVRVRRLAICGIDSTPEEGNRLSGPIPPEIGELTALRVLNLGANRLSGPIPPEIGRLERLDTLLLYSNQLTAIPPEIGRLAGLEWLVLYGNRLEGAIPPEIGRLRNLQTFNAGWGLATGRNRLTGSIPAEIGGLERLTRLDLGGNRLTGAIPPEIGGLRSLLILELGSNRLEGAIPPEIGELSALQSLAVCRNNLEGAVPPLLGALTQLNELYLCTNRFAGPIPPEIGDLNNLLRLNVAGNLLTSELPTTMVSLVRLREFFWRNNDGLCIPSGDGFDEWLAGIEIKHQVRDGDRCASGIVIAQGERANVRMNMKSGENGFVQFVNGATGVHRNVTVVHPQRLN